MAALFAPCTYLRHLPYILANKLIFSLEDLGFDFLGGKDSKRQAEIVCDRKGRLNCNLAKTLLDFDL